MFKYRMLFFVTAPRNVVFKHKFTQVKHNE